MNPLLQCTSGASGPLPTVIVPVHNAFDELQLCLASLAASLRGETQVIVIDDASSDARIIPLIEAQVRLGGPRWRFLRQPRNLGFIETANLGMRLSHGNCVLLNSDTEVTPGWLQRLNACLASDPRIATCTPWSNNGEITSIPGFCHVNPVPSNAQALADALAQAIESEGGPGYPEIPTAVGFCMAISRAAIDAVGYFDSAQFGKGYGEENDFSLRARASGFRNVLCDDAYVIHHGNRSFGPLGMKPDENSMRRMLERHPGYLEEIQAFIQADPLRSRRERICHAVIELGHAFE